MVHLQSFKFLLRPNGLQERQLRRFAGACRFVFNKALALQKDNHAAGQKFIRYNDMTKLLTQWRHDPETEWLAQAPAQQLQQTLKNLERAYQNFFAKRADFPRFKKKGMHDSFRCPDPKAIKFDQINRRIKLPKLGWIRYRKSREVPGVLRNVTVCLSGGKWFVSILTKREVEIPVPVGEPIGIDMGIIRFATLSDGSFIAPNNSGKRNQVRLAKAQRAMSRKVKFSNNWKKERAKVQRIHHDIANSRNDFLHKTSSTISKNHAMVSIEDLRVRNMSRSAKGTIKEPGRNVRAKSGLNRAILDQGWGEFRRQLEYKVPWNGGILVAVPAMNTSRICPECGHSSKENRKTQAKFRCVECGFEAHADLVGATNILRAGLARIACGDTSLAQGASAQEPTEEIRAHAA